MFISQEMLLFLSFFLYTFKNVKCSLISEATLQYAIGLILSVSSAKLCSRKNYLNRRAYRSLGFE